MLNRKQFQSRLLEISGSVPYQGSDYAMQHSVRLWRTFRYIAGHLSSSACRTASVLSLGGGSCYVEALLKQCFPQSEVRLLDFEEVIRANHRHYQAFGIRANAGNLLDEWCDEVASHRYDVVMACEILEHLPQAPRDLFARARRLLGSQGVFVATTPNLGSAGRISALVRHLPIMPPPDKMFSQVCAENEGVHRREYLLREIETEARHSQMHVKHFEYLNTPGHGYTGVMCRWLAAILPAYSPFMLVSLANDA